MQKIAPDRSWPKSCIAQRKMGSQNRMDLGAGAEIKRFFKKKIYITYLPHEAVAEVSKDKEPIGRERAEFNWFESQLMSDSNELTVKWFGCHLIWNSNDFGCQLIWDSIDLVVNRCVLQMILVVCWFELQMSWLSIDLRFKWFGCQLIWDSNDLVVNRFEIKWVGCQLIWDLSDLDVKWFEVQVIWLLIDLRLNELVVNWFEIQVIWI